MFKPLLLHILLLQVALALKNIYSGKECISCLADTNYFGVCRADGTYDRSYCCSEAEINDPNSKCGASALCSSNITEAKNIRPITCPHEMYACAAKSPEIGLSLGQNVTLKVNKLFDKDDSCFYHLFALDRIDKELLDDKKEQANNKKHLQIYVQSMTSFVAYVGNNTSGNMTQIQVDYNNYNFTIPFAFDLYLVMQA